jgi:hypothetical protein
MPQVAAQGSRASKKIGECQMVEIIITVDPLNPAPYDELIKKRDAAASFLIALFIRNGLNIKTDFTPAQLEWIKDASFSDFTSSEVTVKVIP